MSQTTHKSATMNETTIFILKSCVRHVMELILIPFSFLFAQKFFCKHSFFKSLFEALPACVS